MTTKIKLQEKATALKATIDRIADPLNEKIRALEDERDRQINPMLTQLGDLNREINRLQREEEEDQKKVDARHWRKHAPETFEQFQKVVAIFTQFGATTDDDMVTQVKAPAVPGLVVWSAVEKYGTVKYYAAWKDGKLVALMTIDPPRHPGDSTSAHALVGDESLFGDHNHYVTKPVTKWVAALWVAKWMRDGFKADGLLKKEVPV